MMVVFRNVFLAHKQKEFEKCHEGLEKVVSTLHLGQVDNINGPESRVIASCANLESSSPNCSSNVANCDAKHILS